MIHFTDKQLREIQMIELEMLVEIDRICKKHNITYQIAYGTMLGAVRHKGFIPWDDDLDVEMLRPEYEKFRRAVKTDLDRSRFYFQDDRATKGYRWGYGKIRRKDTTFLREYQEHMPYKQGIFVDVIPLDGVPDEYFKRSLVNFEAFVVRKLLYSKVGQYQEKNAIKRKIYSLMAKVPEREVLKHYNAMIKRSPSDSMLVRNYTFPTHGVVYGYLRDWYLHSKDIEFEGKIFPGIDEYKSYLTLMYGSDYMELPPEKDRITHPVTELKLTVPKL